MENSTQILMVMIAYISLLVGWGVYQGRKVQVHRKQEPRRGGRRFSHNGFF